MKYKMNISGVVCDEHSDFRLGFDITVENGGTVEKVGESIQKAIDGMRIHGNPISPQGQKPTE